MNDKQTQKVLEEEVSIYDRPQEDTLYSMSHDFYRRKMLSVAVLVWVNFLVFFGLAVFSAVSFFKTSLIKNQIMYAAVFVCCIQLSTLAKVFAWQMIHKNLVKREIRRLELYITELQKQTVQKQITKTGLILRLKKKQASAYWVVGLCF